jgi:hypothetical protein
VNLKEFFTVSGVMKSSVIPPKFLTKDLPFKEFIAFLDNEVKINPEFSSLYRAISEASIELSNLWLQSRFSNSLEDYGDSEKVSFLNLSSGTKLSSAGDLFYASTAASIGKFFVAPLERMKIILQVSDPSKNFRILMNDMWRSGGFQSLYRSNLLNMVRVFSTLYIQGNILQKLQQETSFKRYTDNSVFSDLSKAVFLAGSSAAIANTITLPIDVIRVNMAVQSTDVNLGNVMNNLYKRNSRLVFFTGFIPSFIYSFFYIGFDSALFEKWRNFVSDRNDFSNGRVEHRFTFWQLIWASITMSTAQTIAYPFDVVRRRMQVSTNNSGLIQTFKSIINENGIKSLYKGASINFIKSFPLTLATFYSYESMFKNRVKN